MNRICPRRSISHSTGWVFFHFDDHFRRLENFRGRCHDVGDGLAVCVVVKANSRRTSGSHNDAMPMMGELANARGDEADAVFMGFDFLNGANLDAALF